MLPFDVIHVISSFLPWSNRCRLVSKQWLRQALRHVTGTICGWRSKKRLYSYMLIFNARFTHRSWSGMAKMLKIKQRVRNSHFRLTWRAAVIKFVVGHCQGCGRDTRASVFGIRICRHCQRNKYMKNCYMITTQHAKRLGIQKNILDAVPFHKGLRQCHLRFWHLLKLRAGLEPAR